MTKRGYKPTGQPRGRPPHSPTDRSRGEVEALVLAGYTHDQIAEYVGIDEKTLRIHYRKEIDTALPRVLGRAAATVVRCALGSPAQFDERGNETRAEVKPQPWALCFLLKTRGKLLGWSERAPRDDDEDAGKLIIEIVGGLPKLSPPVCQHEWQDNGSGRVCTKCGSTGG